MEFIDQPGMEKLLDRRNTSADANVLSACGRGSAFERGVNAVSDEMEGGPARHGDWRSRVMGQHENGNVVRRIFAPPALPSLVRPGTADRPEHVAADDPRADIFETAGGEIIADSGRAAVLPCHPLKSPSVEHPIVQCQPADTERVLTALTWTSTIAINGNCKRVHSDLGHKTSRSSGYLRFEATEMMTALFTFDKQIGRTHRRTRLAGLLEVIVSR